MALLHDLSLYLLYASLAAAVFLAIERSIFYMASGRELGALMQTLHARQAATGFKAGGIAHEVLRARGPDGRVTDERTDQAYIRVQHLLKRSLWMLDTIVTAAPLLGLLGTILGIFDTFTALAKSGISDPQGVSAGIGTALLATAVGIGVALISLLIHNAFLARVERLEDEAKLALMEMSHA